MPCLNGTIVRAMNVDSQPMRTSSGRGPHDMATTIMGVDVCSAFGSLKQTAEMLLFADWDNIGYMK
jgi:hypothetical protein